MTAHTGHNFDYPYPGGRHSYAPLWTRRLDEVQPQGHNDDICTPSNECPNNERWTFLISSTCAMNNESLTPDTYGQRAKKNNWYIADAVGGQDVLRYASLSCRVYQKPAALPAPSLTPPVSSPQAGWRWSKNGCIHHMNSLYLPSPTVLPPSLSLSSHHLLLPARTASSPPRAAKM